MTVTVTQQGTGTADTYSAAALVDVEQGHLFVCSSADHTTAVYAPGQWEKAVVS